MIDLLNCDCMEYMATCEDKAFDLAIVDPPYGIGIADWDKEIPTDEYFKELKRCSKNQIIWGGNYFILPHTEAWICWDKTFKFNKGLDISEFELAWTSFDKKSCFCRYTYCGNFYGWDKPRADYSKPKIINPYQKPVALYEWLLTNYAEPGQRILDTHLGSGSSAIAANYFGVDFVGCELYKDQYDAACERFDRETAQIALI